MAIQGTLRDRFAIEIIRNVHPDRFAIVGGLSIYLPDGDLSKMRQHFNKSPSERGS